MSDKADDVVAALRNEWWQLTVYVAPRRAPGGASFDFTIESGSESCAREDAIRIAQNGVWEEDGVTFVPAHRIEQVTIGRRRDAHV